MDGLSRDSSTGRPEEGRVAVVTGAAQGIGRAIALKLARRGYKLGLLDVDEELLAETAAETGNNSVHLTADCTAEKEVARAFGEIESRLGPVDVLVNNVGQSARKRSAEFYLSDPEVWRFVIDVNLRSALLASRQAVPGMRQRQRGRIINLSSNSALAGDLQVADYAAAKMAIVGFTRSLARELAPFHVTVNALCPGVIKTRAFDNMPQTFFDTVTGRIPMGVLGEPEDVANAAAFLASDDARYMTGQSLVIDGGRCMI